MIEIDGATRIYGVIGNPVVHSLSPAMHNLAFQQAGINARYLPFHVKPSHLTEAVQGFVAQGVQGFNSTLPHKEALLKLMDWVDSEAMLMGAVNTVRIEPDGSLSGFNTDADGFYLAMQSRFPAHMQDAEVIVLGAGGAARGVLAGLAKGGVNRITLANRTLSRAEHLLDTMTGPGLAKVDRRAIPLVSEKLPLETCTLIVNTTSAGMHGESLSVVDMHRLPPGAVVVDIIYIPPCTPFLHAAQKCGLNVLNGLDMLIYQGARSFQIWTDMEMPVALVRTHLEHLLGSRAPHA
ncbi:MAG: shikimate dehydrogenase [Magnetococcales bacterium]|nr:shikimate dehydrogenase [Magnetococcales bacterium]MBF0321445.1 shikimate dehydrogenase [Magnetococcales bacterium]